MRLSARSANCSSFVKNYFLAEAATISSYTARAFGTPSFSSLASSASITGFSSPRSTWGQTARRISSASLALNSTGRGLSVEPVSDANLAEYYACWTRGWETSVADPAAFLDDRRRALATGRFHMYLARWGGEPVGTAGFIVKPRCAYLVGGNVVSTHRGRGVYRALLDERLRRASELGVTLAVTQAREATSAPILEKLGFETLYTSHIYKWEP